MSAPSAAPPRFSEQSARDRLHALLAEHCRTCPYCAEERACSTAHALRWALRRDPVPAGYRLVPDQPEHVIELVEDGWLMEHSLDCRLTGDLLSCPLTRAAHAQLREAPELGRYAVWLHDDGTLTLGDRR